MLHIARNNSSSRTYEDSSENFILMTCNCIKSLIGCYLHVESRNSVATNQIQYTNVKLRHMISYFLLEYEISLDSRAGTGNERAASARDSSAHERV